MYDTESIKRSQEEIKNAELNLKQIKRGIRAARISNFKESILTKASGTVTFLCAGSHLALKYATDKVENTEAFVKKYADGQEKDDVIRERKKSTITTQLEISNAIKSVKDKISDFSFSIEEIDILNNTGTLSPNS